MDTSSLKKSSTSTPTASSVLSAPLLLSLFLGWVGQWGKIKNQSMTNSFLQNFFRKDLKLETKWWHRLLSVVFWFAFIWVLIMIFSENFNDNQYPKYKNIDTFENRLADDVKLINELVFSWEKIAQYEHNLYWSFEGENLYDKNGWWLLEQKYYCAKNVFNHLEDISKKTWISTFEGDYKEIVTLWQFRNYLEEMNADCVEVRGYNLGWGLFTDKMVIWKISYLKTVFSIVETIFFVNLLFMVTVIFYYKIFIYIIFWGIKNHQK